MTDTANTKTDAERADFLRSIGLNADAPGLADEAARGPRKTPAPVAAPSVDADEDARRRSTPAAEIVFEPHMLDAFPSLDKEEMAAASRMLFDMFKSPVRNRERHALLHRRISEFIQQTRRDRATGTAPTGVIREKVKATREQRDLAALMAEHNITAADLAALIASKS